MANTSKATGWIRDITNGRYSSWYGGTEVIRTTASAITALRAFTSSLGITITTGGLTITAGGLTVTAGGASVAAGGATISGGLAVRSGNILLKQTATTDNTAGALTISAAMVVGGILERDPNGAGRTDTFCTGTQLETALNAANIAVATGDTIDLLIINTADAAEAITLQGATGTTMKNAGQTIAQNESALVRFIRTGANTYDVYIVGA